MGVDENTPFRAHLEDLASQVEFAQDACVLLDREFQIAYLNRKAQEILGRPRAELLGSSIWGLCHEERGLEQHFRRSMDERIQLRFEHYCEPLRTWHEFQVNPSPSGIAIWFCDISRRRELQRQAERSAGLLGVLIENVPEGLTITNAATGQVEMVSRYSVQVSKRSREELIGIPISKYGEAWHLRRPDGSIPEPEELPAVRAQKGEVIACEEWLLETADGTKLNVLYNAAPVRDPAGAVIGGVAVWRDITQRKAEQEDRLEKRRMAMATTLAGGIAHKLNNLLTTVIGNISLVTEHDGVGEQGRRWLANSLDAAQQAAQLNRTLLAFVGKSVISDMQPLDLSEQIRNSEPWIRAMLPETISLSIDLETNIPLVEADPAQLREVLMALVTNAVEAIGSEAGTVGIRTRLRPLGPKDLKTLPDGARMAPGEYVLLEVSDTGKGIESEHQCRIFEPFFSTKVFGRGLGLAAVYGVAKGHRGTVDVESRVGEGSQFRLYFPAARATPS
jgi:PAS domain S-box-containing protein